MNRHIKASILLCVVGLWSCQLDQADEQGYQIKVTEDLKLEMLPALSISGSSLNFIFTSTRNYNCESVGYDYRFLYQNNSIDLHLRNVTIPDPCSGREAPAKELIQMPSFSGSYAISINIGDQIKNAGTLMIDQKGYRLDMQSAHGLSIGHTEMYKIPEGTIWGYVYNASQQNKVFNQFKQLFEPHIESVILDTGYYGYFNVIGSSTFSLHPSLHRHEAAPYVFQYQGEFTSLPDLIDEIRTNLPPGTDVTLHTWNGFSF